MFKKHKYIDRYNDGFADGLAQNIQTLDPEKPYIVTINVDTVKDFNEIVERIHKVMKPKNNISYVNGNTVTIKEYR